MTKRFTITNDFEEHHKQIRDNGKILMGCFIEAQAEPLVKLLNELNDENEQLKQQRNSCLNDLNKLEIAIEKVQNEFKDNQEVQRAIARIVVIKRELKGDV